MAVAESTPASCAAAPGFARRFVGRRPELARLGAEMDLARGGCPRLVVVEGPPGVGKTALLSAFRSSLNQVGVLVANGEEAEQVVPFGIVDQLMGPGAGGLAAGVPGWSRRRSGGPVPTPVDPPEAGARLLAVIGELQRRAPVVVVVDDGQWADPRSLQALVFALRRLGADRVLTVVACRDGGGPLLDRLRRMAGGPDGSHLALRGLQRDEIVELGEAVGAGRLSRAAAERLLRHTGGLPVHLEAIFEEIAPDALRRLDVPLPVPRSFAVLVLGRLAQCSPPTRQLVVAVSVLGDGCPFELAARLGADRGAGPVGLKALDEAVAARLLAANPSTGEVTVAFSHPLARVAVYDDLDLAARVSLHALAAESVPDEAVALHHRVAGALGKDQDLAAELAEAAARDQARGAVLGAARHLLDAARLHPSPEHAERLFLEAAELMVEAGDLPGAVSLAEQAGSLANRDRRRYLLGLLELARGGYQRAEELFGQTWEEAVDPVLRGRAAEKMCHLCYLQLRSDDAVQWGRRGLGSTPQAQVWLATSRAFEGAGAQGGPLPEPAGAEPETAGAEPEPGGPEASRAELAGLVWADPSAGAMATLATGAKKLWADDLVAARADLSEAVASLRRQGLFTRALHALGYLVLTEYRSGRWDDALVDGELAVSLAADAGHTWVLSRLHAHVSFAHSARGHWSEAEAHVRAAAETAARTGLALDGVGATIAVAKLATAREDHQGVVDALEPLATGRRRQGLADRAVSTWPCLYAQALIGLGRWEEAGAVLAPFEDQVARLGPRSARADSSRVRGQLEEALGRPETAEAALGTAVELAQWPFGRALAAGAYGAFLRRRGRRRAAVSWLGGAREGYVALGALPYLERCEAELAGCGAPTGRRRLARSHGLTPRELAVARSAAAGATNREIAARLVVSVNTVEFHLRHVFAKLAIASRAELASRLG